MIYDVDSHSHDRIGKFFVIPQNKSDYDFLLAVDRKTRSDIDLKYGFLADYDWMCNTVANMFFESMIGHLKYFLEENGSETGSAGIAFYDLFSANISNKVNEHAEKEGNLNIYFEPGERVKQLIEEGPPQFPDKIEKVSMASVFITEDPEENEFLTRLDNYCKFEVNKKHGIRIGESPLASVGLAYTFFENLFVELLVRAAEQRSRSVDSIDGTEDDAMVTVNFNDNIEFHCVVTDGTASIMMRPGMNVKLLVKNDGMTESTMGDLDD